MFFKYLSAMIIIGFIVCDQASSKISDYNPFRCLANAKTINCPVDGRLTVNPSAKKVKTLKKNAYSVVWDGKEITLYYKSQRIFQSIENKNFIAASKAHMKVERQEVLSRLKTN